MNVETIREVLLSCTLINFGILMLWVLFYWLLHDFIFRLHGKMFRLTEEQFNGIHYAGMAIYKMAIIVFCFVPYIALGIVV